MPTPEPIANEYLAAALRAKHPSWQKHGKVVAENTAAFHAKGQRPDIIVCEDWASPVGIETEYFPANSVEQDAAARLGQTYNPTGGVIHSVIAVRYPARYKNMSGQQIGSSLEADDDLEYCLLSGKNSVGYARWPATGFLRASVSDLAIAVSIAKVSPELIEEAAEILERGARLVATQIENASSDHPGLSAAISAALKQDAGFQTYAMTATILINAFVFQETLSGASQELITVSSIYSLGSVAMRPTKGEVIQAWDYILSINYWPIFGIARKLLDGIPPALWPQVRDQCLGTADALLQMNLGKNPDLVGIIFQRLISDRKFLATFYTAPSSAAMMAKFLVRSSPPNADDWGATEAVGSLRIADFACGTGSLLCAVYSEMRTQIEHAGVDSGLLHRRMVEDVLVGCDVLPSATYITASQLSSAHPTIQYGGTTILTLPFGQGSAGDINLGALDLLESQGVIPTIATHSSGIGATAASDTDTWSAIGGASVENGTFDIVAMNPPFTRLTGGGGKTADVTKPLFAAFGTTKQTQDKMGKKADKLLEKTTYHGNAGAASAFVEIGHRKLKSGGRLGLILPLSALSGMSWAKCRDVWKKSYRDIITISIASSDADSAFSADTGMAECMVIGTKSSLPSERLISVSLHRRPNSTLEGAELARSILDLASKQSIRRIEDGPVGGSEIMIGGEKIGEVVTAPISPDPWPLSRIRDHGVAQSAFQLGLKCIWLPGSLAPQLEGAPVCPLGALGEEGPYHLDVSGAAASGGAPRGPFEIKLTSHPESVTFPVMKAHNEARERFLELSPDAEGIIRTSSDPKVKAIIDQRANTIWESRTRLHFATDVQFNSNALVACLTTRAAIGGRAWPSFLVKDRAFEKAIALWFNSTLGILSFWWSSNKTQDGRGSVTTTRLREMISIDPRGFSDEKLSSIEQFFDSFKHRSLMDIHECDLDDARADLDVFVITKMLGLGEQSDAAIEGLSLLRSKLVLEPSIRGARRSKTAPSH
jgi:hypothetical protein